MRSFWHALIFDLDDTLFDTSSQLLPAAHIEAAQAMIAAGLQAPLQQVLELRQQCSQLGGDPSISAQVAMRLGCTSPTVAEAGERAFFERDPGLMSLEPDVAALLERLLPAVPMALVTAGHPPTQLTKIRRLDLERYFADVRLVDRQNGERKREALRHLLVGHAWTASRCVVVGDREDDELAAAMELGCRRVRVCRDPSRPSDVAEVTIHHVRELEPALEALIGLNGGGPRGRKTRHPPCPSPCAR